MRMRPEKNQVTWAMTIFILAICLMLAYYVIFNTGNLLSGFNTVVDAMSGIIVGAIIAYLLIPLMTGIESMILEPIYKKLGYDVSRSVGADKKKRSQMRKIAIVITMVIFFYLLYSFFSIIIPQIISSIKEINRNLPSYIRTIDTYSNNLLANNPDLQAFIDSQLDAYYENLSDFLTKKLMPLIPTDAKAYTKILKVASQSFLGVIKVLFDFIVGFIVAIYILNSKETFTTQGKKLCYAAFKEDFANELIGGFRFVNNTFQGFIGGKLLDSLIIGIICYFGCLILGISYPVLIAVIVGVTNVIPFFGPYIGGGMGALLLVMINPIKALVFLIFVIVLQQFDGNILGPLILGSSTGLSSFWVIFAITFFGGIWGIVGLLVGVPIFAVFYALVARITNKLLVQKGLSTNTTDYDDLAYIEDSEYKLLSDKNNTKFNSRSHASTLKRVFKLKNRPKFSFKKGLKPDDKSDDQKK